MATWICKVCGYTHQGDEAPERCAQCGAAKSQFYREKLSSGCAFRMFFIIVMLTVIVFSLFACRLV